MSPHDVKWSAALIRRRIAVVGSGVAGLSAAWLLSTRHEVDLYEAESQLGGHANTVDAELPGGERVAVDTGFIVFNNVTYPNLTALLDHLGVETTAAQMSFSVSMDQGTYCYSGHGLPHLLGRPRQWLSLSQWRLIAGLVHFYRTAEGKAARRRDDETLGAYLAAEGYSRDFIERHILPMAGAIWSASPGEMLGYPFQAFVRFFSNHGLFNLGSRPIWRSVRGGSRAYVSRLAAISQFRSLTDTPVSRIQRTGRGARLTGRAGLDAFYDDVVLACHADTALGLLEDADGPEHQLLSPFRYSLNRAVLHQDQRLMPTQRRYWSAWNYRGERGDTDQPMCVTYWMNALQQLTSEQYIFVTLNPDLEPEGAQVLGTFLYRHPVFSQSTLTAQRGLWQLQGRRHTWFCGAWFGAGFHEDGLQAGLAVAEQLGGVRRPWKVADESGRIHLGTLANPLTQFPLAAE
jgi:predicted NAD/FAD-binding protein